MRAVWEKTLSPILNRIMADVGPAVSRRIDLSYPDEKKTSLLKNLTAAPPETVAGRKVARITDIDGVKFVLEDDSWFLIRPSGTEPSCGCVLRPNQKRKYKKSKMLLPK